jgi:hypothetical protein
MPRIMRLWLAVSLTFLAGAANLWAQPAPPPKPGLTATKPAPQPKSGPAATKPAPAPQIARDALKDYPASNEPGVIFVGPRTMEFLKRLGPNAVFFTSKDHPLERLADLTDTDSQFAAWGIPPFSVDDLFNLKFMVGGKPEHLRMIGNLNFTKLFQQNPKLKLFVTSSKIPLVETIERDGGGMKVSFKLFDAATAAGPAAPTVGQPANQPAQDQKTDTAELAARYPDADVAAREMMPGVYEFTILKANTQIGSIGVGSGGPSLNMTPSFLGKKLVFLGNMTSFIGVAGSRDFRSRIVNVAALDYDSNQKTNPALSALGVVALNEVGVVKSDNAKTGWINWRGLVKFDDGGRSRTVQLNDVTFWVNRGGANWLSFTVAGAQEVNVDGKLGAKVPVTVSLDSAGQNGSVTIRVADRYAFHPSIKNYTTLDFVTVAPGEPIPQAATTAAVPDDKPAPQPTVPVPSAPAPSSATAQAPGSEIQSADTEAAAWKTASAVGTPAAYRDFYRKYPRSPQIKTVTANVRGRYWYRLNDPQKREGVIVSAEGVAALVNLSLKDAIDEKVIGADAAANATITAPGMTFNYVYVEVLGPWTETYGNIAASGADKITMLRPTDRPQSIAILSADGARLLSWDLGASQPVAPASAKATFVASAAQAPPFNEVPAGISKEFTPFSQGVRLSHTLNKDAKKK